jgi:hypothetical protein
MAYREIDVDGKKYEYVIGRKNVKIKDIGIFLVAEIGAIINVEGTGWAQDEKKVAVTPAIITEVIKAHLKQLKK